MPRGRPRVAISPCQYCSATFNRLEHLRRHERIHTNEKPFSCPCGLRFSRQDLLQRHGRLAHISHVHSTGASSPAKTPSPGEQLAESSHHATIHDATGSVALLSREEQAHTMVNDVQLISPAARDRSPPRESHHVDTFGDLSVGSEVIVPLDQDFTFDQDLWLNSARDLDLLYNHNNANDFLPANFFDTNLTLSEIWQTASDNMATLPSWTSNNASQDTAMQSAVTTRSTRFRKLTALEAAQHTANSEKLPATNLDVHKDTAQDLFSSWNLSAPVYSSIYRKLAVHQAAQFTTPSRFSMARYIEGYFRDFHKHLPFLHPPTVKLDELAPELILSMCAMGAFFRFEHTKGYEMYFAARSIITTQLQSRSNLATAHLMVTPPTYAGFRSLNTPFTSSSSHASQSGQDAMKYVKPDALQTLQSLIILTVLASWGDPALVQEALCLSNQVAMLAKEAGMSENDEIREGTPWLEWIAREVRRRTLMCAYVILNMQSFAFNVPPQILNHDVGLCLPHCGSEWVATSAAEWTELRQMYGHDERPFRDVLHELMQGRHVHTTEPISAMANYVLIIGIVQQIFFARLTIQGPSLDSAAVSSYEMALQAWQLSWEATQESSLNPASPKGPLGFNSAAVLRLAYLRLNADMGPHRELLVRDPHLIALSLTEGSKEIFERSSHIDRAILQSIHALSILINTGIRFVAHTQALNWSIELSICNLECAFLLSQWLQTIARIVRQDGMAGLRDDETRLLSMLTNLIGETAFSKPLDEIPDESARICRLSTIVVRLWAETLKGVHVFQMVDAIGNSLSEAADIFEREAA